MLDDLSPQEIINKYGEPDWIGSYQNPYATKIQWFYHLGAGKVRYVFFVNDILQWDWVITEDKMLQVIYENHKFNS